MLSSRWKYITDIQKENKCKIANRNIAYFWYNNGSTKSSTLKKPAEMVPASSKMQTFSVKLSVIPDHCSQMYYIVQDLNWTEINILCNADRMSDFGKK